MNYSDDQTIVMVSPNIFTNSQNILSADCVKLDPAAGSNCYCKKHAEYCFPNTANC